MRRRLIEFNGYKMKELPRRSEACRRLMPSSPKKNLSPHPALQTENKVVNQRLSKPAQVLSVPRCPPLSFSRLVGGNAAYLSWSAFCIVFIPTLWWNRTVKQRKQFLCGLGQMLMSRVMLIFVEFPLLQLEQSADLQFSKVTLTGGENIQKHGIRTRTLGMNLMQSVSGKERKSECDAVRTQLLRYPLD